MIAESDLLTDLDDFVAWGARQPDPGMGQEPPTPEDAEGANRLLRALRSVNRQEAQIDEMAEAEVARIRQWQEDRTAGLKAARERLERSLDTFMRAHHSETGTKTLKLANGELALRAPRERIDVTDAVAFRDWAEGRDRLDLLRIKVEADKSAVGGLLRGTATETDDETRWVLVTDDGEVVPGIEAVVGREQKFKAST